MKKTITSASVIPSQSKGPKSDRRSKMYLECTTSEGLFSSEYSVDVASKLGTVSLFVDKDLVHKCGEQAYLEVETTSSKDDWTRVVLPQEPLSGTPVVEVRTTKLSSILSQ